MEARTPKLRIAVIGAGIAGLCATIALQKHHEDVEINIYERATQLQEIGASIALGPNGLRTLERLGVHSALDPAIAFRNKSGFPMIYRHWQTNEIVSVDTHHGEVEPRHTTARFYRVHLQQALLSQIDASHLHLGKTFHSLENSDDNGLRITFTDGTEVEADILLGADGIRSAVRQFFVPSSAPKWTGWTAFRAVFPAERVAHISGALDEAYHWWGPERTFFSSPLGKDLFTVVGGHHSDPRAPDAELGDATWNSDGDVEVLRGFYAGWNGMVREMLEATPGVRMYPNTFAESLETWVQGEGRVTFAGDAAHAHGGAFAAGGSLAADDAYAFAMAVEQLLQSEEASGKRSVAGIERALKLYEATRKAHTDRVLSAVRVGNEKTIERLRIMETDEELRLRMKNRADPFWIHEHDVEATFARVLAEEGLEDRARL